MRSTLALFALALAACSNGSVYTCQAGIPCGAAPVQTCCSTSACEYRVDGMTFACRGTDCTSAALAVRAYCPAAPCPDAASPLDAGSALDASGCVR